MSENRKQGVLFPAAPDGRRSTTWAGKEIFSEAVRRFDADAAQAILNEPAWHRHYPRHILRTLELSVGAASNAVGIARSGLAAIDDRFEFRRDGEVMLIRRAMERFGEARYGTATVRGLVTATPTELQVPYRGEVLRGEALQQQLNQWEQQGIVEPSHAEALRNVARHPEWLDLSDQRFVLLGAGAELSPLRFLLERGAEVLAVDLPRPELWIGLLEVARSASGTLRFPVRELVPADASDRRLAGVAGADLIADTPEICTWLAEFEGPMVIGCYAYLDGKDHVLVTVAADAIMQTLLASRRQLSLAFLNTATDGAIVPLEAAEQSLARFRARGLSAAYRAAVRRLTRERLFAPNVRAIITAESGKSYGLLDNLVIRQGPNYALAKRVQQWRALVARNDGVRVSANVAPASGTTSVMTNRAFAAAYAGAYYYGAEIFEPTTTNALMAALLVHDLRCNESAANPAVTLDNPLELFMDEANHGGVWRMPMQIRSVLEVAALRGWRTALKRH